MRGRVGVVEIDEGLDRRRHRHFAGARVVAVVDLDGDAEPALREGGAEHALGADLAEYALAQAFHDARVEAIGAADHERVRGDGGAQPFRRRGVAGGEPLARADPGEGEREVAQRDRVGRNRAAIRAARGGGQIEARRRLQRGGDAAHDRMIGRDVAAGEPAHIGAAREATRHAQEAGVLAGAVVAARVRRRAGRGELALHGLAGWPVRAALERVLVEPGFREHARDHRRVCRLAVVRRACDGQLLVGETERVGGAALDQRQGLQDLDRRAREDRELDVADRDDHRAVGVDDRDRPTMRRFALAAADRFDEFGIHRRRHVDKVRLL